MEERLGHIRGLFSAGKDSKGVPRPKAELLELIEGHGIKGDKFAGEELDKTVLIVGENSYDLAKEHGIELEPGSFGENILFDFDPHELGIGSVIKMGDAKIQVTEKCTICSHLAVFGKELPKLVKSCRGLYCKIIESGNITKGTLAHVEYSPEDILKMNDQSLKLYNFSQQFPNHFTRLKTYLLMKEFQSEEELDAQIAKFEQAENLLDELDDFAEYPDFVHSGYLRTDNAKITHMGGVAAEIELTFPASNGSFLQILNEKIKAFTEGPLYLACAIDMVEISPEKSSLQQEFPERLQLKEILQPDPEILASVMMDEDEWAIYNQSLEDGEYESAMWNMGIFVIRNEKQLADILGFFP